MAVETKTDARNLLDARNDAAAGSGLRPGLK